MGAATPRGGAPLPREPTTRQIDRRVVALAIPAVGALIADPLLGVVDTAVAGQVSVTALGALGLGTALLTAGTWIFNFLVVGTTTSVARAMGAGDAEAAGRRVAHAAWIAAGLGLVVGAALLVGADLFVRTTGAVDALVDPAVTYMRIRAVGLPFILLGMVGHGALRGVGDTRTPLVIVLVANAVNAALDVVLVVVFDAGLVGVAWATVASEVVAVAMMLAVRRRAGLLLSGHGRPNRAAVRAMFVVSRDVVLRTGGLLLGLLLIATAAARVDIATAAGHQVLFQIYLLTAFVQDSVAVAGQTMIGTALGRGDAVGTQAIVRRLTGWGVVLGVGSAAGLLSLGGILPPVLTDDPAALAAIAAAWTVASIAQLPGGVAFVLDGVLMGADDWAYLRTWTVTAALGAGLAAQLVTMSGGGLRGLWWCVVGMTVVRAISLLLRVRSGGWVVSA
jgi:putative MATE family efflux protein